MFFLFTSCESNMNVDIPGQAPKLTVNCILKTDEAVTMQIIESQFYLESTDTSKFIRNAMVQLFEDNILVDNLIYKEYKQFNQKYNEYKSLSGFIPRYDHTYQIKINALGFEEATSKTRIPHPIQIISIVTIPLQNENNIMTGLECSIRFKDTGGIKNYYRLVINRIGLVTKCIGFGVGCENIRINYNVPFSWKNLNAIYFRHSQKIPGTIFFEKENDDKFSNDEIFLADDTFDGMTFEMKVWIPSPLIDWAFPPNPEIEYSDRKINFHLYSVNEDYFKYAKSYFFQVYKKTDLFSEPIQVFSNINHAFGIFSSASSSIDSTITLPVFYHNPRISK